MHVFFILILPASHIWESWIKIKINSNFYFHTSFWCLKRFYEGLQGRHKTFWGFTKKFENKNLTWFFHVFKGTQKVSQYSCHMILDVSEMFLNKSSQNHHFDDSNVPMFVRRKKKVTTKKTIWLLNQWHVMLATLLILSTLKISVRNTLYVNMLTFVLLVVFWR